jgi:hypothetical protein
MAKLTILGREFDIAPYKLGELRKAAPFIDAIQKRSAEGNKLADVMESAIDLLEVLSIGLVKIDPMLTPDYLEANVGMDEFVAMQASFVTLTQESGLKSKGEATAPLAKKPAGASKKA